MLKRVSTGKQILVCMSGRYAIKGILFKIIPAAAIRRVLQDTVLKLPEKRDSSALHGAGQNHMAEAYGNKQNVCTERDVDGLTRSEDLQKARCVFMSLQEPLQYLAK